MSSAESNTLRSGAFQVHAAKRLSEADKVANVSIQTIRRLEHPFRAWVTLSTGREA